MICRKNLLSVLLSIPVLFATALFLAFPARYAKSVFDGISLWALNVLPSLFPFLFLTGMLSELRLFPLLAQKTAPVMRKLFKIRGNGGCTLLLSALSGYPVGARLVFTLNEGADIDERFRLSCLCSTASPAFLVGVVGAGMLNSVKSGWMLLFSHFLSVYAVGFFLGLFAKKQPPYRHTVPPTTSPRLFAKMLEQSVSTVLYVGGYVALFTVFGQMLADCGLFSFASSPLVEGFLRGLLEMTGGCAILSASRSPLVLPLVCFLSTFGGACILMQQLSFLKKAGISAPKFLLVKLLQATLSGVLCYVSVLLFP